MQIQKTSEHPRRSFISKSVAMVAGSIAAVRLIPGNYLARASSLLGSVRMRLKVENPAIEPTTIQRIEAKQTEVKVHVQSVQIGQIAGNAQLRSRLTNGKLRFDLSPHIDVDVDCGLFSARRGQDFKSELTRIGLSSDHADKTMQLLQGKLGTIKTSAIEARSGVVQDGWTREGDVGQQPRNDVSARIIIPLPDIPINLNPNFDVRNFTINNIDLRQTTNLVTDNLSLNGVTLNDFELTTELPDPASLDQAEILNFRIAPIAVPQFGLKNLKTEVLIPRLGSSEVPLELDSQNGSSDIQLTLIDWHPRWSTGFGVLWCDVSIEFGIDLRIELLYRWVMTLLHVSLKLRDAFVNGISIAMSIAELVFTNIKVGLLKFRRLLYAKA